MKLPVTAYIVMMHHQDVGTFAPAFPNLEDAIDFSNAMRLVTNNMAIAEPVPLIATESLGFDPVVDWIEH
jgi:hypothetical protein